MEPVALTGTRKRHRRFVLALVAAASLLALAGGAIAAGLGPFAGLTTAHKDACTASRTRLALTTQSGGRVFVGQAQPGDYCLVYQDGNGTSGETSGSIGGTPAGDALVLKALDTVSNKYVIAALVPDGFDTASIGGERTPITNAVFVADPDLATKPVEISGSAGTRTLNLAELAGSD